MHYELFLSYSREDNKAPVNAAGHGWVRAFADELRSRHATSSGRQLSISFDQESRSANDCWRPTRNPLRPLAT